MGAAALVLFRARLAMLVAPDRNMLGAVVRGDVRTADGKRRGRERERAGEELLRQRPQPGCLDEPGRDRPAEHGREHARALKGQPSLG